MRRGKAIVIGAIVFVASLLAFIGLGALPSQAITEVRDCDNGAIIYCGALTESELRQKYASNKTHDLPAIYSHYGISSSMITGGSAKSGYVTKTGNVVVDGKTVATGAYTAGRLGYPSSRTLTVGGTKLYEHSTQTSFRSSSIPAYIWYDANGQFVTAILKSCGNPIKAAPVPVPPKPVYTCNQLTSQKITRTEYAFSTSASAKNGAKIISYIYSFGDGTSATGGASIHHTYKQAGTYHVSVTVKVDVNGKMVTAPGNCETTVKVAEVTVQSQPAVTIEKTVNGAERQEVTLNQPFTYQVTVRNNGNVALKNALVTDSAPTNITFTSSTLGSISNNAWSYTIPELAVGQSRSFSITAKLTAYQAGDITNTACVETPTVPGGNPDVCDTAIITTKQSIQVCDTTTNAVVSIDESEFDQTHMTKDMAQCDKMTVCKLDDKTTVTIARRQFDTTRYTTDMSQCQQTTVTELPHTGVGGAVGGSLGIGSMAGALYHYGTSRRQLRKAMLKQ